MPIILYSKVRRLWSSRVFGGNDRRSSMLSFVTHGLQNTSLVEVYFFVSHNCALVLKDSLYWGYFLKWMWCGNRVFCYACSIQWYREYCEQRYHDCIRYVKWNGRAYRHVLRPCLIQVAWVPTLNPKIGWRNHYIQRGLFFRMRPL